MCPRNPDPDQIQLCGFLKMTLDVTVVTIRTHGKVGILVMHLVALSLTALTLVQ